MGEIEETQEKGLLEGLRRRIAGALLPSGLAEFDKLREENEGLAMRLARVTRQRDRLASDIGLLKATTWANLLIGDYNPDKVSLEEYVKMMDYDSQVRAGFDLIEMGVLMKPWRIRHPDEEVTSTLTAGLQQMRKPSLRSAMKEMLTSICYGYSVTEIVFDDYKGKFWLPRRINGLKTLDPQYLKFFSDEFGNLRRIQQQFGGSLIDLPLNRTLVWSHGKKYGNWYGESILRGCYKNWFIKDAMLKFANIAYERFGAPIMLGFASTVKDRDSVEEAIEHLFAYSQATILKRDADDPTDIKVLESKRAEMPFDRYIRYQDEMILRRMLIGQKLFEGGGGVYGPKVPFDIILMRFEDFRLELMEMMNEMLQIVCELNWDLDAPPQFDFAPLTTSDMASLRQSIFDALDRKILEVPGDEDWIRQELGFPQKRRVKQFARALPGRYFVDPHAAWLASGKKVIVISTKAYSKYADQEIYIVGDGGVYGTMKEGGPQGPFSSRIQKKYHELHKISAEEWNEWWPGVKQFWIFQPEIIRRFDPPLKYSVPTGVQVYIKKVIPEGLMVEEGGSE